MRITLVKKILADGSPCRKCNEVINRLEESGQISRIDEILIADQSDPTSPGMMLAAEVGADRAPFFVVDFDDGSRKVYTVYFKFAKEVLQQQSDHQDSLKEILHNNPDLDLL